jgi:murein DD-endopeptidase MepM/ murein hydrolase activator NlpD
MEVPRWYIKLGVGVVIAFLGFVTVSVWGWVHYRNAWLATEDIRVQNVAFDQERAALVAKLTSLEQTISRVDRFATKLEASPSSKGELQTAIGPISEGVSMPSLPKLSALTEVGLDKSAPTLAMTDFHVKVDGLKDTVGQVEERLQRVYELRQDKISYWASVPTLWPVAGFVTSGFGYRRSPLAGGSRFHEGIDIASPVGTPIKAPADGVVTFAGYKSGLGKCVVVDHGYGISTMYGHNASINVVEGDRVKRGMEIASIGMTGRTTGPHLHYQVMVDNVPIDPLKYLAERL